MAKPRLALEGAFETGASQVAESVAVSQATVWRRALPWVAGAALLGGLVIGLTLSDVVRPVSPPPAPVERFVVTTPATAPSLLQGGQQTLAISPDGTRIVYRAISEGLHHLYVRSVDQLEGYSLFSSQGFANPTVSPDGAWVIFANGADATWKKVSILGGPPLTLFPISAPPRGASWGPDDTIILGHVNTGLSRGPAGGGEPEVLTTPDAERGETGHFWPEVLPGGEAVLFTVDHGAGAENMELAVLDLATMEPKILLAGGSPCPVRGHGPSGLRSRRYAAGGAV